MFSEKPCVCCDFSWFCDDKAEKIGLKDEFYGEIAKRSVPKKIITDETEFARKYEEMKAKYQDRNFDYLKFL